MEEDEISSIRNELKRAFKDEKELDKFVQFLKSPIERMWNE